MIVEILFIIFMALWFLADLPVPQIQSYKWISSWFAFVAVLLLGAAVFVPDVR